MWEQSSPLGLLPFASIDVPFIYKWMSCLLKMSDKLIWWWWWCVCVWCVVVGMIPSEMCLVWHGSEQNRTHYTLTRVGTSHRVCLSLFHCPLIISSARLLDSHLPFSPSNSFLHWIACILMMMMMIYYRWDSWHDRVCVMSCLHFLSPRFFLTLSNIYSNTSFLLFAPSFTATLEPYSHTSSFPLYLNGP